MKSDILNNECTEISPCKNCPRHLQGLDKNNCIDTCEALKAYREGRSWEGKETVKIVGKDTEAKDRQLKCEMLGCNKPVVIRGLCQADYDRWRNGTIEHPRLGMFKRTSVSVKKGTCLIENCDEIATLRGLCSPHYQSWRKGHIKHPVLGVYTTSQAKSRFKKPKPALETTEQKTPQKAAKRSYPFPDLVTLDFTNYPEIKNVIFDTAQKLLLPAEHVVVSLISEGIMAKTKRS